MMQKFELRLKNEKVRSYRILYLLFILLNLGFLLSVAFSTDERSVWTIVALCLVMTAGAFITERFLRKKNKAYSGKAVATAFLLIAYISLTIWWAALALIVVSFLYIVSVRDLVVSINAREIIYPSFPKKRLGWMELNNIILKDGLLTIDFKNNRLAQSEVINGAADYDVNEKEFNEFCRTQLASIRPQTI